MGVGLYCSCFGKSGRERLTKEYTNDQEVGLPTSIIDLMKRTCSRRSKNQKITKNTQQEKKQQLKKEDHISKEFSTLQDCLLASPALNRNNGGEVAHHHHVLKQNKVYPSFAEDDIADYASNGGSFTKQRPLKVAEIDSNISKMDVSSSSRRSQIGNKIKKRVSFKLPVEAEIFIYNVEEEEIDK
ncbi:hypothetical protein JCGZ_00957 [Jatropha curcas]|uniref:Uncharacterized protein n=1 Tax=Jatropha curcas TaxID=180498 RepID=A0A067L403_JATCU|nr:hypothetical protein JCGZ_00957 [Jatropha curcas]